MALRRSLVSVLTAPIAPIVCSLVLTLSPVHGQEAAKEGAPETVKPGGPKPDGEKPDFQRPPPGWKSDGPRPDGPRPDGPRPDGPRPDGGHRRGGWMKPMPTDPEEIRDRLTKDMEKLTPEQRMEFWRTVWAVINMPADKRKELIGEEDDRRKKVREEIEQTLKDNNIVVEEGRRREFFMRYFGERKSIEAQLIKEGEERRAALLRELGAKLKNDFSKPPTEKVESK